MVNHTYDNQPDHDRPHKCTCGKGEKIRQSNPFNGLNKVELTAILAVYANLGNHLTDHNKERLTHLAVAIRDCEEQWERK